MARLILKVIVLTNTTNGKSSEWDQLFCWCVLMMCGLMCVDCFCRHYLFYLIHCQLLNEEEPDDINAYERFVLNKFLASDISWMPVGKALTMPGTHNNNAAEENKKGSGGGATGGGGLGGDDESLKETVDEMKGELKALAEQMDGIGKQMTLLLSTLNNRN